MEISIHKRKVIGNSKGGISKAKILKRKYEAKLEFPESGGGVKPIASQWGGMDILRHATILHYSLLPLGP